MQFSQWLLTKLGVGNFVTTILNKELKGDVIDWKNYNEDKILRYNQLLNKLWFSGNAMSLQSFYKLNPNPESFKTEIMDSSFWRWSDLEPSLTKVHSSFPASVSQAMSTLLFSSTPVLDVKTGNKETDKRINKVLDEILVNNNIDQLIQEGSQLESYSGGLAAKFSIDKDFSNYPIIEFYPQENVELRVKYGRTYEIVFSDVYSGDHKNYLLQSHYGYGYIKYKLYEVREDGSKKNVNLNKCEDTKDLRDIYILGNDGKPLNIILAVYKKNRTGTPLGRSDYEGLSDIFNVLDSYESLMANYFRYGAKVKTEFHESELEKDKDGNIKIPSKWGVDAIVLKDSNPMDTSQGINRELPLLDTTAFTEALNNVKKQILDRVGLSYSVFGLGNAGAGEAAEALTIRQENSYKTREEKLMLWRPFLCDICRLCLVYFDILNNNPQTMEGRTVFIVNDKYEFDYLVRFAPYKVQTDKERALDLKAIMDTGLMTKEDAIREYYKDELSEEEIEEKIKELMAEEKKKEKENETKPASDNTEETGEKKEDKGDN